MLLQLVMNVLRWIVYRQSTGKTFWGS